MRFEKIELRESLLGLERQFWTGGVEFYEAHTAAECLMVFPGVGILSRLAIIAGIASGARWITVDITDAHVAALGRDAAIVAYSAVARRDGLATPYAALVSSAYRQENGSWKLAFHQQSPLSGPGHPSS